MPVNQKEMILRRILAVLDTVDGVREVDGEKSVFRNRHGIENEKRPGIILLDGSLRIRDQSTTGVGRNRTYMDDDTATILPCELTILPQIFVLLELRDNLDNLNVGEDLSAFEIEILSKISTDEELWSLLGGRGSGKIEYRGNDTDMQTGSSMEGSMRLDLSFTYTFDPADLR